MSSPLPATAPPGLFRPFLSPQRRCITPPLVPGEVHVWRVLLGPEGGPVDAGVLSDEERACADRFRRPEDRVRSLVSRAALRELLARYVGATPAALRFTTGPHGKPALGSGFASAAAPAFNVAHSGRLVLLAFAMFDVGIDVEEVRAGVEVEDLARRFFAPEEAAALHATSQAGRVEAFFRIWTRKEAFLKAYGTGLSAPLDAFSTTTRAGAPRHEVDGQVDGAHWYLHDLAPAAGYAGAVVTMEPARVVLLDLQGIPA